MSARALAGFTLIEVLVAMGIVAFGLLSLLTLLPVGLRSTGLAGDFTTAAFLGQQELDRIRSRASARDDGDFGFFFDPTGAAGNDRTERDNDGLGYFDLPLTIKKGELFNLHIPDPARAVSQTVTIEFVFANTVGSATVEDFVVTGIDADGNVLQLEGLLNQPFPLPGDALADQFNLGFELRTNAAAAFTDDLTDGLDNDGDDIVDEQPEADRTNGLDDDGDGLIDEPGEDVNTSFFVGESMTLHVEVVEHAWYAYWAFRYDYSEDRALPQAGLPRVDGILTDLDPVAAGLQTIEDTGLDMVPDSGETGSATVADPHGDDGAVGVPGDVFTGRGTEGNEILDAFPENQIQRVTVVVLWREGGRDRQARFSTLVANQYL